MRIASSDPAYIALYAAPYACVLAYGAWRIARLGAEARRAIAWAAAAAAVGAVLWAWAIHANPWSPHTLFYHLDDASYDRWGREMAQRWREGDRPDWSRDYEIGTLHTGYYRFVAALYFLFGPHPRWIIALNLLACAALPAALYLTTLAMGGEGAARRAAWLGALYPSFWFYGSFLLRDAWIALFFLAALIVYYELTANNRKTGGGISGGPAMPESAAESGVWSPAFRRNTGNCAEADNRGSRLKAGLHTPHVRSRTLLSLVAQCVCLLAFAEQLFLLRYYLLAALAGAILLRHLALGGRRTRWIAGAILCAGLAVFLARLAPPAAAWEDRVAPYLGNLQDRLIQSFTWSIPRDLNSLGPVAKRFAAGTVKLFLAPLPWATKGGYVVDYFLWPGQWILYLLLLPFGLWGMARAVREGRGETFVLLFPFLVAAYGFIVAYGGSVPRQRMFLDALLMVFAACALQGRAEGRGPGRRWLVGYYACLGLFIAGHVASLFVRGIW